MGFVNIFIGAWNALTGSTSSGSSTEGLQVALLDTAWLMNDWINTILWSLDRITSWYNRSSGIGPELNVRLGNAVQNIDWMIEHIVVTIIPQSINAALANQKKGPFGDIYARIRRLWTAVDNHTKQIRGLWGKVHQAEYLWSHTAAPFFGWWHKTGRADALILEEWIKAPGLLSAKLTATMAPDLIGYWSTPANRLSAERLLTLLLARAPLVTGKIDQAAVAVLNSGRY